MQKNTIICLICTVLALFTGCKKLQKPQNPVTFTPCAKIPVGRASAASFVIDNKAYVLCGRTKNEQTLNDMWQYDTANDSWTQLENVPAKFKGRVKAVAQVVGESAYIGLGYVGNDKGHVYVDTCYLRDFWRYTPATKEWKELAKYPTNATTTATTFATENAIYVVFGFFNSFTQDVYKYDIQADEWTKCKSPIMHARGAHAGCSGEAGCFAGTGYNTANLSDWWCYSPENDLWYRLADIPGKGREFASALQVEKQVFLMGGRYFGGTTTDGFLFDDLLEYDVNANKWLLRGHLPGGGREHLISFSVGKTGYFGLGSNKNGDIFNDLYRWNN